MSNKIRLKRGSGSDPSASDLVVGEVALRTDNGTLFTKKDDGNIAEIGAAAGVSDGDKGDITVSNSGSTFTIDSGVVTSSKIADGTIVNADINASAAIAGTKISSNFGSQQVVGANVNLISGTPTITFEASSHNPDYMIQNQTGKLIFQDTTNSTNRLVINTDGHVDVTGDLDVSGELEVTGHSYLENITLTAGTPTINFIDSGNNPDYFIQNQDGKLIFTESTGGHTNRLVINTDGHIDVTGNLDVGAGIDVTGDITGTGDLTISSTRPRITLNDTDSESDFEIKNENGSFRIRDIDNPTDRYRINSSGTIHEFFGVASFTSNIAVAGTVDGVDIATRDTLFGGLTSSSGVLSNGVTATTQSAGDNSTKVATTAYTDTAISNLVDSSPSTLNTLNELAAALGDDASFSTTVTNSIATKMPLAGGTFTGDVTFNGGAGAATIGSDSDIRFTSGSNWSGNTHGKIQLYDDQLYIAGGSNTSYSIIFRYNAGNTVYVKSNGTIWPANDSTSDLGTSGNRWANIYGDNFHGSGANLTNLPSQTDQNFTTALKNKLDGIEASATADQTASEILTLIKTVDGSGSGLDADTLDGANASVSASNSTIVQRHSSGYIFANYFNTTANDVTSGVTKVMVETGNDNYIRHGSAGAIRTFINVENGATADQSASEILNLLKTVDGSGSGLDADTLDGVSSGSFLRSDTGDTFSGDLTSSGSARILLKKTDNNVSDHIQFYNGTTRVGEIGCHDGSWLRLNQVTGNNIYTPRYIRADNGFFVDGTSKGINGSGNFIGGTIAGASDYGTLIRSNAEDSVTGHTEWQDNYQVRLGAGADMRLYHNGSHSYIDNHTNVLHIRCNTIKLQSITGEQMLTANANGSVELYRDNDRVFYTETRGVRLADNTRIFENSSQNTAVIQHADIHHAIVLRGATNNNGSSITNENTTTFREYGQMQFRTGGNGNMPVRLTIASNGVVSGNLNDTSDAKFKENIVSIVDGAVSKIKQLRPVNFDWKKEVDIDGNVIEDKDTKGESGFIAQEVLTVIPDLVKGTEYNDDEKTSGYSVNTTGLVAYLTKALQEVITRVETLEAG